jgi:hypothetical protein
VVSVVVEGAFDWGVLEWRIFYGDCWGKGNFLIDQPIY